MTEIFESGVRVNAVSEQVKDGTVKLKYRPTKEMTAYNIHTDQRPEPRSIHETTRNGQNGGNTSIFRHVRRSVGNNCTLG